MKQTAIFITIWWPGLHFYPPKKTFISREKHLLCVEDWYVCGIVSLSHHFNPLSKGLREAFHKFDDDHDGVITRGEFRRLLKLYMITMTDHEFDRLMNKLRVSHDATLDYKEFLKRFEKQEKIESHGWLMRKHRYG